MPKTPPHGLRSMVCLSLLFLSIAAPVPRAVASQEAGPAQEVLDRAAGALGGWNALARIVSVRAAASVSSPRGSYQVELLSARGGRFVMRQLREGKPVFEAFVSPGIAATADGSPLSTPERTTVVGHDFFGIVLDPRAAFFSLGRPRPATFLGNETTALEGLDAAGAPVTAFFDSGSGLIRGLEMRHAQKPGVNVVVSFDAWAENDGVRLPSSVTARDDLGSWVLRFTSVRLNDLARGDFEPPAVGAPGPREVRALLRLHEEVLEGHRARDARWLASEGDDYVVGNRGLVTTPSLAERTERFRGYLGRTRFETYRDRRAPLVRVSGDGTLGWVVAEVEAEGTQTSDAGTEPVSFVCAWVELYAKSGDSWKRVGNVSTFRP